MSRGFVCALVGIGMTIFSWVGPWEWPAWPALLTLRLLFGSNSIWGDLSFLARSVAVSILIAINVATWALIARGIAAIIQRVGKSRGRPGGSAGSPAA